MQAFSAWTAPSGTLGELVRAAEERARALGHRVNELQAAAERAPAPCHFARALRTSSVAVIAEVKRRSPSKGWINAEVDPVAQALAYQRGGAAAISFLTEPERFGGSNEGFIAARSAVGIPMLRKDFHVDPLQLVEARALGAAAALLIARAVAPAALERLHQAAVELGLETLVEVRDEREMELALAIGAPVIGINNRNLETLAIDPATSERLLRLIPDDRVAIAESGVNGRDDVVRAAAAGADAVLVGSSISAARDPEGAVRALADVPRTGRR